MMTTPWKESIGAGRAWMEQKKAANYEAMLHLACAIITLNLAGVLG
jgi:hypothetical protein